MGTIFVRLFDFFSKNKLVYFVVLAIVCAGVIIGASTIKIDEDVSKMMPMGGQTASILKGMQESKIADKLVVLVTSENQNYNTDSLELAADLLNISFRDSLSKYIRKVSYKSDENISTIFKLVQDNIAVFLEDKDYERIDSLISSKNIELAIENDYKTLSSASGIVLGQQIMNDPLGITNIVLKKLSLLQINEHINIQNGYLYTEDNKSVLMVLSPSYSSNDSKTNSLFLEKFKQQLSQVESHFPDIKIQYYGAAFVADSNASQLKKDSILTLSITIIGLILFLGYYFKKKRITFLVFLPIVFGAAFALSIIALTVGSISTIALGAGCVILGIGINYSLHFIHHFKHSQSVSETIVELIAPLSIGSFTTVASFYSLTFVSSPILNDFGRFAAWSLIGTSFFTLIFLPVLLPRMKGDDTIFEKLAANTMKPNKWIALGICIVTVILLFFVNDVQFESDLNQLSYQTEELKSFEKAVNRLQGDSVKTVYITTRGQELQSAIERNQVLFGKLATLKTDTQILHFSSIAPFIVSAHEQQRRVDKWNQYWDNEKVQTTVKNIQNASSKFGFKPFAFQAFYDNISNQSKVLSKEENFFLINTIAKDLISETDSGFSILSSISIPIQNRNKVYPQISELASSTILDKQLITNSLIDSIYKDFNSILLYCSLIVFIALYLSYGRLEIAIMTFIPMLLSWIWILGIMGLLGLKFNIVNIVISTFIFGLGDDFSIFISDALNRKFKTGKDVLNSHKTAILLASVTTILGLGALIFAKHPALRSIAWLSILGLFCVILIGQTIQPLLFNFFIQNRKDKGQAPWTLPTLFLAIIAFSYFVVGSFILAILGLVWIHLIPFPSLQKRKLVYHFCLSKFVKSLVYLMANVKKVHIHKELADFSKPSIIISNHQSFLDILVTVMQHPKIILLTNDWVYNSPFFGKVVQLADYYPVAEGAEMGIERLRKKVNEGYSVVIFPEGTRSKDGVIKRFKKGAFYLAEQLQLDIQPLLLHGTGDTMRKGDFMLYNGQMTMSYLPRISWNDKRFGQNYSERTKNISKYFKESYETLKKQIEQPIYFKQRLEMNYIYKGPVVEWYTMQKIKIEGYYEVYHRALPTKGDITDLGCGYGYMAYMLHFLNPDRILTGVDFDEDKVVLATNNFSKDEQINFVHANLNDYSFVKQDAFIINDVLHYLNFNEQELLLEKCLLNLNADGIIIIKDANEDVSSGQRLTWLSEFFSINLGFNMKQHDKLFFTSQHRLEQFAEKHHLILEVLQSPQYSSNTIWSLTRRV